jgi:predicted secreted Zn-dependent protease
MDVGHLTWRKSNYTGANGNCVEVAQLPAVVAVRDSKDPGGPKLTFSPEEWRAFVAGVKAGEFGLG